MNDSATIKTPGVYRGLSFADYIRIQAINHSTLKAHDITAREARRRMTTTDDESDDQRIGHATHAAVFEPAVFAGQYVRALDLPRRSNADKKAHEDFANQNSNKVVIPADEYDASVEMREAIKANERANAIITSRGEAELTIVWKDEPTGLLCKSRVDWLAMVDGFPTACDLKTTRIQIGTGCDRTLGREVFTRYYHTQTAFYLDGLNTMAKANRRWLWLWIDKASKEIAFTEPTEETIDQGRKTYRRWLAQHAKCVESGNWPGFTTATIPISIPAYGFDQEI